MTVEEIKQRLCEREIYITKASRTKSSTYFTTPIPFFSKSELQSIFEVLKTVEQFYIEYVDGFLSISINNKFLK